MGPDHVHSHHWRSQVSRKLSPPCPSMSVPDALTSLHACSDRGSERLWKPWICAAICLPARRQMHFCLKDMTRTTHTHTHTHTHIIQAHCERIWFDLHDAGCSTAPPSPRKGASLVVSEDGRKLWIFGGNSGHGSLNDLYSFDIESCMWCQVNLARL